MMISLVVAADEQNGIGADNNLLWHLPTDMAYFKELTMGHHVLMGKNTWLSIPPKFRPLPGRVNMVLTRDSAIAEQGALVFDQLESAIEAAKAAGEKELMIIGGAQLYAASFHQADRIYLTRVHQHYAQAQVHFPEIQSTQWELTWKETKRDSKTGVMLDFLLYERSRS